MIASLLREARPASDDAKIVVGKSGVDAIGDDEFVATLRRTTRGHDEADVTVYSMPTWTRLTSQRFSSRQRRALPSLAAVLALEASRASGPSDVGDPLGVTVGFGE